MIDKNKITVTMSLAEYEELDSDVKWWQGRFNSLKKIALRYANRDSEKGYFIEDCVSLAFDIEEYLNDEDY